MTDPDPVAAERGPLPDYHCPMCGVESRLVISARQAFCTGGDECQVPMFNPSLLDGGLSQAETIDLGWLAAGETEPGPPPQ